MNITHFADYNNYACGQIKKWLAYIYNTYILVVPTENLSSKQKQTIYSNIKISQRIKWDRVNTSSVTTTEYSIYPTMSNLSECQVLQVLTLLVWIRVGIRILREVKGQHFANDTVSLLWTEEKANSAFSWPRLHEIHPLRKS